MCSTSNQFADAQQWTARLMLYYIGLSLTVYAYSVITTTFKIMIKRVETTSRRQTHYLH